jgi:hypothetical protein
VEITVINSWTIQKQGIIAELKYQGAGLPKGTRLVSKQSGIEWLVKGRLIFYHTFELQKRFSNETEIQMHFTFNPKENKDRSQKTIFDNEAQGIYQYLIESVQHDETPKQDEKLVIKN